jgi:hypothetical protein
LSRQVRQCSGDRVKLLTGFKLLTADSSLFSIFLWPTSRRILGFCPVNFAEGFNFRVLGNRKKYVLLL